MNRHQNKLELLLSDAGTGISHVIYTEESKTYIEINDHWHFLKNNSVFLLTSEKSGFRHIYVYTIDGKPLWQLTSGNWEVTDIAGVDEENNKLYYVSTELPPLNAMFTASVLMGTIKPASHRKKELISPNSAASASILSTAGRN